MNAIIDFLLSILDILVSLVQFFVTLVSSMIWLIGNIPQITAGVTAGFAYAPSFVMPFLILSIAIMVVVFVIRLL